VYKLPREDWDSRSVEQIMTPMAELRSVSPEDSGVEALNELGRREINQLPVVEDGRVRGLLRREDVLRWISVYGERGLQDARV
jgi:signal-transduction protein with cAMP-binding, CBS, and nucleotidyltransferase domain